MKKLLCLFGFHKFTKTLDSWAGLEVKECENCKKHLNINHQLKSIDVRKPEDSILHDIKYVKSRLGIKD